MNKYQAQLKNNTTNELDWLSVFANSKEEAWKELEIKLYEYQHPIILSSDDNNKRYWKNNYKERFKNFEILSVFMIKSICEQQQINDTIYLSNTKENEDMDFFKVNWNDYIKDLSKLAAPENWSNSTYPNNGILVNYMVHTFEKLKSERNIVTTKDYSLFNTGLFTDFYEPIFAYATDKQPVTFMTPYELGSIGIDKYPERANYFKEPSLLLFDWHYQINIHYKHILKDINNIRRIPENIQENKNILNKLNGSIETMKKRVSANYKLAIPQYFDKKIQLLLPLCLETDNIPDLALVVTKVGNIYQGHTCLTLDMAYNNARLIAKPENNWLNP